MNLSNLIFLDTETTGNQENDRLCQLAFKRKDESTDEMFCKLYKPPIPISIESMAVHHITEEMVNDRPYFKESEEYAGLKELLEKYNSVMVAHNAPFDKGILEKEDIYTSNCIDTLKLVRHYDPEMVIQRHNLQYLRYFLKIDKDISIPIQAHDAKSDVVILEHVFNRLYSKTQELFDLEKEEPTISKMIELSSKPALIGKFAFGKYLGHKVKDIAKIDPNYLEWLLAQKLKSDQNEEDWIYTIQSALNQ